eukprot:scaffold14154_cov114-Skeletonema_dohrnii-CCMP3373.AAC.2
MASTTSSWSDRRDHAVVPWISLGSSATATDVGGSSSPSSRHSSNYHDGSVTSEIPDDGSEHYPQQQQPCSTYTAQQHQSCKILSLLSTRERIGIRSMAAAGGASVSRAGWLYEGRNVSTTSLAMSGAW